MKITPPVFAEFIEKIVLNLTLYSYTTTDPLDPDKKITKIGLGSNGHAKSFSSYCGKAILRHQFRQIIGKDDDTVPRYLSDIDHTFKSSVCKFCAVEAFEFLKQDKVFIFNQILLVNGEIIIEFTFFGSEQTVHIRTDRFGLDKCFISENEFPKSGSYPFQLKSTSMVFNSLIGFFSPDDSYVDYLFLEQIHPNVFKLNVSIIPHGFFNLRSVHEYCIVKEDNEDFPICPLCLRKFI